MAYRRFKLSEMQIAAATVANPATVRAEEAQSVADLATVAGADPKSEPLSAPSVAGLATVARVEADFAAAAPASYRAAYADLCAACPAGVPVGRWQWALADAERFLGEWGRAAERLGWTANDLFGLHPTVPLSRMDHMGLCWLLKGQRVVLLTATEARFERGLTYRRSANTRATP